MIIYNNNIKFLNHEFLQRDFGENPERMVHTVTQDLYIILHGADACYLLFEGNQNCKNCNGIHKKIIIRQKSLDC